MLSGGGNLGALQVGMLRALLERRIEPDLILGCSVGALNGAAIASDPSLVMVGRLQEMWRGLGGGERPARRAAARGPAGPQGRLHPRQHQPAPGHRRPSCPARTFEDLQVPFQCVATALVEGTETWFDHGPHARPDHRLVGHPRRVPAGGDRRAQVPRRRRRQRRAGEPGRRAGLRPHLRAARRVLGPAPPGAQAPHRHGHLRLLARAPQPVPARPRQHPVEHRGARAPAGQPPRSSSTTTSATATR